MNRRRRDFVLALILFFGWVGGLTLMAGYSGERPRMKGVVESPR